MREYIPKRLEGKNILLGISGSIAAYKACEMLRVLQREGADVQVVMTDAAQQFITHLTFETLSKHDVVRDLFPPNKVIKTRHVSLAEWADCILVCPATANIIGKVAAGIADDFLSTVIMASRVPVLFAPAMDYEMVQNPIYLENCEKLRRFGYEFVQTESGELASGAIGPGRLADFSTILFAVRKLLAKQDLMDVHCLVTAGPTREKIDPVRFVSNFSSGKMGFAIAEEAVIRGASVTLVSGPSCCDTFADIQQIRVESAAEMAEMVKDEWKNNDVLIMSAAVADYRPSISESQKIKKKTDKLAVDLEPTEDILASIGQQKAEGVLVGFALETEDEMTNAVAKLHKKNLDIICLNNPLDPQAGFEIDVNKVTIIKSDETHQELEVMPKWQVAQKILDEVTSLVQKKRGV